LKKTGESQPVNFHRPPFFHTRDCVHFLPLLSDELPADDTSNGTGNNDPMKQDLVNLLKGEVSGDIVARRLT
jgi:hypothetical protein